MAAESTYDYAVIRVVPRVERGEMLNAGVILSCPDADFLDARIELDESRLLALDAAVDIEVVRNHLAMFKRVCDGGDSAGEIGRLPQRARFHWLVSPRSTIIQCSAVHTGRTGDPAARLERLLARMVR